MKNGWIWNILKVLAILVILSHLYFEVALIIKVFIVPSLKASGNLKYYEGLGLFAPIFYGLEGVGKVLEGLSPLIEFTRQVLFVINSFLLIISIVVTRFVFKNKSWAGVIIVLLLFPACILWVIFWP